MAKLDVRAGKSNLALFASEVHIDQQTGKHSYLFDLLDPELVRDDPHNRTSFS